MSAYNLCTFIDNSWSLYSTIDRKETCTVTLQYTVCVTGELLRGLLYNQTLNISG